MTIGMHELAMMARSAKRQGARRRARAEATTDLINDGRLSDAGDDEECEVREDEPAKVEKLCTKSLLLSSIIRRRGSRAGIPEAAVSASCSLDGQEF